jgi:hypothetical protein
MQELMYARNLLIDIDLQRNNAILNDKDRSKRDSNSSQGVSPVLSCTAQSALSLRMFFWEERPWPGPGTKLLLRFFIRKKNPLLYCSSLLFQARQRMATIFLLEWTAPQKVVQVL